MLLVGLPGPVALPALPASRRGSLCRLILQGIFGHSLLSLEKLRPHIPSKLFAKIPAALRKYDYTRQDAFKVPGSKRQVCQYYRKFTTSGWIIFEFIAIITVVKQLDTKE
jgi:hypothetical protein